MASRREPLAITGVGLATSLGGGAQTSAGVRAGLTRPAPLPGVTVFDEELGKNTEPSAHVATGVTDGFVGVGRAVRLALAAWRDLERSAGWKPPPSPPLLHLGIPTSYYLRQAAAREAQGDARQLREQANGITADQQLLGRDIVTALATHGGLAPGASGADGPPEGAAAVRTFAEASVTLEERRAECVLVGAVDSLAEPMTLASVQAVGLLHTADAPTGFIPGEAAAFLALESRRGAERRGARILGTLWQPYLTHDQDHRLSDSPPRGRALQAAIEQALGHGPQAVSMIGSLNGDAWRAQEWGTALTRLPRAIAELPLRLPAASLGELGSAFPLVAAAVAVCGRGRDRVPGHGGVLVWVGSDDGARGAFVVGPPPGA